MKKAYLVLADGTVFEGVGFGASGGAVGEIAFTTSVVGYIETLSDPVNCGRIVVQTFPQIGNYGMIESDLTGPCRLAGYVVREWCGAPCNFRSEGDIDAFLKRAGIPGIAGVDTRALTRHIRENGVMNAAITDAPDAAPAALRAYRPENVLQRIGRKECAVYGTEGEAKYSVTVIDYGCGGSLTAPLTARGCTVTAVPYTASAEEILAAKPDGVILSDGAGDPSEDTAQIEVIAALAGRVPLFAAGLGHQLLALAMGARTERMSVGHYGGSYPVRDAAGSRTYITRQNHAFAVCGDSVTAGVIRYVNANDRSCEGIDYPEQRAFSVQFDPALAGASADVGILFDRFIAMLGGDR